MIAQRRFGVLHPVHTTNFLPHFDREACTGCGKCVAACPVEAMALVSANDPRRPNAEARPPDEDSAWAAASACAACAGTRSRCASARSA